jgi:hypothetical protein
LTDNRAADAPLQLFQGEGYPSQLAEGWAEGFHGEYRGFYPSDSQGAGSWSPSWSHQGDTRPGGHAGVDIYAPFAPHPLETPLLALFDGTLKCRHMRIDPNPLGNRVELELPDGGRYSYGHLSRFEGKTGDRVKRGDVIGYSGCSGNADGQNECRGCKGHCNVNSGHVHLSLRNAQNVMQQVIPPSGLRLRFGPTNPLPLPIPCASFVAGPGLKQQWSPPPPDPTKRRLEVAMEPGWTRSAGRTVQLPPAFRAIAFDDARLLLDARDYYRLCRSRIEAAGQPGPLNAFLEQKIEAAILALAAKDQIAAMRKRIIDGGQVIGLGEADAPGPAPGWLLRHLSVLCQMLWVTCGGPALDLLSDNAENEEFKVYHRLDQAVGVHLKSKVGLECGASLGGTAWLSAADQGRHALHLTDIGDAAGSGRHWVLSVTFGIGSLMHATVSERMKRPPPDEAPESADVEAKIAEYLDTLSDAATRIADVYRLACKHPVLLSGEGNAPPARRAQVLSEIRSAVVAAADRLAACPPLVSSSPVAPAVLRRIASVNELLFEDLLELSRRSSGVASIRPNLFMLQVRNPAA